MQNDSWLITGAHGFLAKKLCEVLYHDPYFPHELIAIHRTGLTIYPASSNNCPLHKKMDLDLTNPSTFKKLSDFNFSLLIHSAAMTSIAYCEENPDKAYAVNVEASQNLLDLARRKEAQFVFISTDTVFNGQDSEYVEEDLVSPLHIYGKSKLKAEKIIQKYSQSLILRTHLFGSFEGRGLFDSVLCALEEKRIFPGFIDSFVKPLYIMDFIRALRALLHKDTLGTFHLVGPKLISKFDFLKIIARVAFQDESLIQKESFRSLPVLREPCLNLSMNKFKKYMPDFSFLSLEESVKKAWQGEARLWDKNCTF